MPVSNLSDSMEALQLGVKQKALVGSNASLTKAEVIQISENKPKVEHIPKGPRAGRRGKGPPKPPKTSTPRTPILSTAQITEVDTTPKAQTANRMGRPPRSLKRGSKKTTSSIEPQTSQQKYEKTESHILKNPPVFVRGKETPKPSMHSTSTIPIRPAAQISQSGAIPKTQNANNVGWPARSRKRGSKRPNCSREPQMSQQKQEKINTASSGVECQQLFAYVIQAWFQNHTDTVIGVYTSLSKANQAAFEYAASIGISRAGILDISSSVRETSDHLAVRRVWPNGFSDIRIMTSRSPVERINVLPKDLPTSAENMKLETLYLAQDMTPHLFIIGAYLSKEEAWEACRKYWLALSFSTSIENMEQWYDEELLFHAKGRLGGAMHHWFVQPYNVDVTLNVTSSKRGKSLENVTG